ncbi:hypothetical protein AAGG52_15940 [Bacillus licheniformis]
MEAKVRRGRADQANRAESRHHFGGEHNRYGHPHGEVLDILNRHHVKVFRTDRHGSIQYLFRSGNGTFLLHPPYDKVHSPQEKRLLKNSSRQKAACLTESKAVSMTWLG